MFKVIVAGSRDFNDYELLKRKMIHFLSRYKPHEVEIVSGGAKGADALGERFAKEKGCHLKIMKANWDLFGKSAGYIRNEEMAIYADACVCFWNGVSRGTKRMIDLANKYEINVKVVRYKALTEANNNGIMEVYNNE